MPIALMKVSYLLKKAKIKAAIFIICALLVGFLAAFQFNAFLEIRFNPKSLPTVPVFQATYPEKPLSNIGIIEAISMPKGSLQDDLYLMAVAKLADAIEMRTGRRPEVVESPASPGPGRMITVGSHTRNPFMRQRETHLPCSEGFSIRSYREESHHFLAIEGGGRMGNIYGMYWLIDTLYSAMGEQDLFGINVQTVPELKYRFVDSGAVGVVPDTTSWGDDYSHHNRAFQDVILIDHPYVNEKAFQRVKVELKEYIHRMISYGYNGVVFNGFMEFVNFDRVGNGLEIYDVNSPYRKRHIRLAECFSELFAYAHSMGMKVLLRTDMLALTTPLERYFYKRFGGLKVSNKEFWGVYSQGLEELFDVFPYLDGMFIRIGEGGAIYNLDGWLYYSTLKVKTEESVKAMLQEILSVAEEKGKKIFFRNWSVGVGRVGAMHTNPQIYESVLGEVSSPNLIVSTKYGKGDFMSYLPHNPTLQSRKHKRIIEFQARREFEGFGAFPNYMGPFHQMAMQDLLKQNPKIKGIWLWTQRGGPLRAGPLSLYPFHGFWTLIDANVYVTGRLAWHPKANLEDLTRTWVRKNFGGDPQTVYSLMQLMFLSHEAVLKGHYIGAYARKQVCALGIDVPPNVWIWDILSGSSSVLSAVYYTCQGMLEESVAEGFEAMAIVRRLKDLANRIDLEKIKNMAFFEKLLDSLDYEENLFETLAWYRRAFLHYYHWLDTGDSKSYRIWTEAYERFREVKQGHLARYAKSLDFPAYNFYAADVGMAHAKRSLTMIWVARCLLFIIICLFLARSRTIQDRTSIHRGGKGPGALWIALIKPWAFISQNQWSSEDKFLTYMLPLILIGMSILTLSSFLSPHVFGWSFLSLLVFVTTFTFTYRGETNSTLPLQAAILAPMLCLAGTIMTVVSVRGPLFLWYVFWTSPGFRILFLSLCIACTLWMGFTVFMVSRTVFSVSALHSVGNLFISIGTVFLFNGLMTGSIGLEAFLTALNKEMAVIPLSLSKVLGITTHLNIDPDLPSYVAVGGAVLSLLGWIVGRIWSKPKDSTLITGSLDQVFDTKGLPM